MSSGWQTNATTTRAVLGGVIPDDGTYQQGRARKVLSRIIDKVGLLFRSLPFLRLEAYRVAP